MIHYLSTDCIPSMSRVELKSRFFLLRRFSYVDLDDLNEVCGV